MKEKPITHRCEFSVCANTSIRLEKFAFTEKAWYLRKRDYFDDATPYMAMVARIKYCPFCGERLDFNYYDDQRERLKNGD